MARKERERASQRSIGARQEQAGPNMGNDYSRNITREAQEDDNASVIIQRNKKTARKKKDQRQNRDRD